MAWGSLVVMVRRLVPMRVAASAWAADHLPVEGGEFIEASLDVEYEDESVFEGADAAAGDPAPADGFAEEVGGAADLHGGVEVAPQQVFGVFAIEGEGGYGFFGGLCLGGWFQLWPEALNVVDGRGQELGLQGRGAGGCGPEPWELERKLEGGAHWRPAV
jgi:hypothetical protein